MALNILVVDDSAIVRAVIIKTLNITKVDVNEIYEASNGELALKVLDDNWIDIIFCDINMPVMTGIELVDRLNKDGLLKSIPVVIVSTEGSSTRIEELKNKGISAYIRKPFTPEQIKEIVDKILGDKDAK
jgi:two-component system, chemotaxis family, chemotaxis protein CheY